MTTRRIVQLCRQNANQKIECSHTRYNMLFEVPTRNIYHLHTYFWLNKQISNCAKQNPDFA